MVLIMDIKLVAEMIECLSADRQVFHYYPHRYAVFLLQRLLANGEMKIADIKRNNLGSLLNKPIVQQVISNKGDGLLCATDLDACWPVNHNEFLPEAFIITLGCWGDRNNYRWNQTSRPGANLVLQLNFTREHDKDFDRSTGLDRDDFNGSFHPTAQCGRSTLAWARMDIDLVSGQALIEELQTDWLRDVQSLYRRQKVARHQKASDFYFWGQKVSTEKVEGYCNRLLTKYKHWSETLLMAVLAFLWDEVGVKDVFYHSYDTGQQLKNIGSAGPPRSLYTDLPRRFCFQSVNSGPDFIEQNRSARRRLKKVKTPEWFYLSL